MGIFTIISFSFVKIRYHPGVLLILVIIQILWTAKDLCGSKAQFFSLGVGRDTFIIIFFNFINIRHYLGVLLILGIFEIIWAANDLV